MNLSETATLLGLAAAYDKRTVGEVDVRAWQDVLADVKFEVAVDAVKSHYRNSREFLMPADIRRHAKSHSKTMPAYRPMREVITDMEHLDAIAVRRHDEIEIGET